MPDLPPEEDELELEPIDPEILAHQRKRGQRENDHAQAAIDAELTRQTESPGNPISLNGLKEFRFTTQHLMILTALLALVMAFCQGWGAWLGLFVTAVIAISAGWYFTMRHERRQRHATDQRRRERDARKERKTVQDGEPHGAGGELGDENRSPGNDGRQEPAGERPDLDFSFSLKETLIAFTAAAMLLGLANLLDPGPTAFLLGMIALGGLAAQVAKWEIPSIVTFGWWLLLVLYLLLGLWSWSSATREEGEAGNRKPKVIMQVGPDIIPGSMATLARNGSPKTRQWEPGACISLADEPIDGYRMMFYPFLRLAP